MPRISCFLPASLAAVVLLTSVNAATAQTGPITNADVVLMVTNKLTEKIILGAIDNATSTAFDTTADGLIKLQKPPDSKVIVRDRIILEVQKVAAEKQPKHPISNAEVLSMVAAGLGNDVVLRAIDTASTTSFDVSPKGLVDLKVGKVSDSVVRHMQEVSSGAAAK